MKLTIDSIEKAMTSQFPYTGKEFWQDRNGENARIVEEATRRGYLRRFSTTQVEWTEEGLERARKELKNVPTKYVVEIEIPDSWIEDGYGRLTAEKLEELLMRDLPYGGGDDASVTIVKAE